MNAIDDDELERHLEAWAREAGATLMDHLGKLAGEDIAFKGRRDLVTAADKASEDLLVGRIRAAYPDHRILAEESAAEAGLAPEGFTWILDPLDGTTNFVHELPMFAVSIGLFRDGQPHAGCIFAPRLDELFLAVAGRGASLNGKPCSVSETTSLIDSMLATGFAYEVDSLEEDNLDHFAHMIPRTRAIRRCGSAAMDMAYTACGRFDGFWELHLAPWDTAAGAIVVREAGGVVTDLDGGDGWLFGRSICAGNPAVARAVLQELKRT